MANFLNLIPKREVLLTTDILDRFFGDIHPMSEFKDRDEWLPAVDLREDENEYTVTAELPGMDIKDIDVTLSDGILTLKGEKKQEHENKGKDYHRIERSYGAFYRSFRIPGKVKTEDIDANYKDGILKLTLPKAEESKPKKIEVR